MSPDRTAPDALSGDIRHARPRPDHLFCHLTAESNNSGPGHPSTAASLPPGGVGSREGVATVRSR
jgi:hypothetical protein